MYMVGTSTYPQRDTIGIIDDSTNISEQSGQVILGDRDSILFRMEYSVYVIFHQ